MPEICRRDFVRLTCAGVVAMAMPRRAGAGEAKRPNILLVLSDDHSYAALGCSGNPDIRTPNFDRFAGQGMRLDRGYVTCPQCVPSRASIMSGRSPVAIDMTRFSAPLPGDVITYPELLRAAGYYTGVAGRTYHLEGGGSKEALDDVRRPFSERLDYAKTAGQRPLMLGQYREFLDAVPAGKPFFLQLCFSDPHRPLDANAIPRPHDPKTLKLPRHFPDTQLLREDLARYYDEVARLDGDFAEVLGELDKRGLADNTIVAFMGDNGGALLRGKGTLYEFGIHVPLLVRWPGVIKAGSVSSALVSGEDLAPTFLEAAGLKAPKEMTGRSFLKLLRGETYEPRRQVFVERGAHGSALPTNTGNFDLGRCVVTPTHKLIYNALWQLPYSPVDFAGDRMWKELGEMNAAGKLTAEQSRIYFQPTRPMFELYDLANDPAELNNLAGNPEVAKLEQELKLALQEWMIRERDYLPLPGMAPRRRR